MFLGFHANTDVGIFAKDTDVLLAKQLSGV
jgi:hypothetical protein